MHAKRYVQLRHWYAMPPSTSSRKSKTSGCLGMKKKLKFSGWLVRSPKTMFKTRKESPFSPNGMEAYIHLDIVTRKVGVKESRFCLRAYLEAPFSTWAAIPLGCYILVASQTGLPSPTSYCFCNDFWSWSVHEISCYHCTSCKQWGYEAFPDARS